MMLCLDHDLIKYDIEVLHERARGIAGRIVLASFGEDPQTGVSLIPKVSSFGVGDSGRMTRAAFELADVEHRNVYASFAGMRANLPSGRKGGEEDIEAVFGLVADFDARTDPDAHRWAERLPLPPTMVLETSSRPDASFQCRFFFEAPVSARVAKRLARALYEKCRCDHSSVDVTHVWRIAGAANWPNRLKVEKYGRPEGPQLVGILAPFDSARLVSPFALAAAMGVDLDQSEQPAQSRKIASVGQHASSTPPADLNALKLPKNIRIIVEQGCNPDRPKRQDNSRSAWLFHGICGMFRAGVSEEVILSVVTDRRFNISESVLDKGRRSIDYARRQIERAKAETADATLEAFNARHAVVENYGNRTVVVTFALDGKISHRSFEDFKKSYDHRKKTIERDGKIARVGEGTAFLENPNRRQFRSVTFLPGKEAEEGVLNLYRGPSIQPRPGDCSGFLAFVQTIVCSGVDEICEWLLSSIAHLFQKPWEPPEVCTVLRGRQGVGKNVFAEWIGEIVADYFMVITNPKHLVGGFNKHLMETLLVLVDEAMYGNEKRYAGIIKNLVTQSKMAVEPKGVDVFMAQKFFRLIMASNEDYVVPADLDDRRMLVIDVSDERANDHAYFEQLRAEWDSGGREAFYDAMLKRDISAFNHRKRPETAALVEQKLESLVGAQKIVFEMLSSGQGPFPWRQEGANFVVTEWLIAEYSRHGIRATARALALELGSIAHHTESKREIVYGRQARGFWLPGLADCRKRWAETRKLVVEWGDIEGGWISTTTPDSRLI